MRRLLVFGSYSAQSSATANYYLGIYRNLTDLGFEITFAHPGRAASGKSASPNTVTYGALRDIPELLCHRTRPDLVIQQHGQSQMDWLLSEWLFDSCPAHAQLALWDADAPATLAAMEANALDDLHALLPEYDRVFVAGGGAAAVERYLKCGASDCHLIYPGLDSTVHYPVAADPELACDLLFAGERSAELEPTLHEFFLMAAQAAPEFQFNLRGAGWESLALPPNVRLIAATDAADRNRLYCSARAVLSLNCGPAERTSYAPPAGLFEAAGAGACVISNVWDGIASFFEPGCQVLMARNAEDVLDLLRTVDIRLARETGKAMRKRALLEHTYALRALELREVLRHSPSGGSRRERLKQPA